MSELENIYYNLYILKKDYANMPETKAAINTLEASLGSEAYVKHEDEIIGLSAASEKQGFIYGFQYAVSLLMGGKGVAV